MDIAIINPRVISLDENIYSSVLEASLNMPPLGILYLATLLKKYGYDVKVYDLNSFKTASLREQIIQGIIDEMPKVVAVSALTPCYPDAVNIMKSIRRNLEDTTKIIVGGYHATFLPEMPLINSLADVVVRGEGEYVLLKLVRKFLEGTNSFGLNTIESISFRNNGLIVHNPPNITRINDLNNIPFPDRNLLDITRYNVPGTIMGSRGCIGKCRFCSASAWGSVKDRSTENILCELKYIVEELKIEHVCYIDNTFLINHQKIYKLFDSLDEISLKCSFSLETRVNNINEEILKLFKRNNVVSVQYGVESGDERVLSDIRKGITLKQVVNCVEKSLKIGLKVMCSFIIGHPADTEKSVLNTIDFAKSLRKMGAQVKFEILTPYPGTDFFRNRKKYGLNIINWDFSKWGTSEAVYETKFLTGKKINKLFQNAIWEVNTI